MRTDSRAKDQSTISLGSAEVVQAIWVGHDGSAWVLSPERLFQVSQDGTKVLSERKMQEVGLSSPKYLEVDELGG